MQHILPREYLKDAAYLLIIGSFLLTVELLCLQLTILAFLLTSLAFTYSWSSFAYNGKVRLIRALRDCKQRSLTVSKKAPTVSKKASPIPEGYFCDPPRLRCKTMSVPAKWGRTHPKF